MKVSRVPMPGIESDTVAIVADALVPMLHWRSVPVLRLERRELNLLERFVLELGLALGTIEPDDFAEVTSLPSNVLSGATWRLVAAGVLTPDGPGYRLDAERAATALRDEKVGRRISASASFALFPRTGDLLSVPGSDGGWLRSLDQRLLADGHAPLPSTLWTTGRAAYLGQRVRDGDASGLSSDIVDVPLPDGDDPPLARSAGGRDAGTPSVCPAYRCRAKVRRHASGGYAVDAVISGRPRRGDDDAVPVEADLSGAAGLISWWLELTDALNDSGVLRKAWLELGPDATENGQAPIEGARRRSPSEWDLLVSGEATRDLCEQGRSLLEPMGLAIAGDEAVVEVACRFFPADDEARALFTRDEAISRLLALDRSAEAFTAILDEARARFGPISDLTDESVRRRCWRLGHHQLVYTLREREDLAYD